MSAIEPDAATRLRELPPIAGLSRSAFRDLLGQTAFRMVRPGTPIFQAGARDDWTIYLLDGLLELEVGSKRTTLRGGAPDARGPIGHCQPRKGTARAVSDCVIARVPSSLLDVLVNEPRKRSAEIEVTELEEEGTPLENQLLVRVYDAYARGELEIPSLPDVAVRIRRAVEDPDVTAQKIDRIVTADPAIAARLIQVANSPAYAGAFRVESCRDAVTRLGFATTRELVTSVALKQLFRTQSSLLKERILELWQHSTRVAAVSYQLARSQAGFSPDRALLAGLIHDIGALPVLASAQDYEDLVHGGSTLDACVIALRGQVGALVLRQWDFPEDLVTVAREAEDWHREGAGSADYCDLVLVAQILAAAGTARFSTYPKLSTLPAFERLTRGRLAVEETLAMLDEAQQQIDELQRLLAA